MSTLELLIRRALPYVGGVAALGAILLTYMLRPPAAKKLSKPKPTKTGDPSLSRYDGGITTCTSADAKMPIRFARDGLASKEGVPAMTIPQVFQLAVETKGNKVALRVERPVPPLEGKKVPPPLPLDQWKRWTYQQYYEETKQAAKALMSLGVEQFGSVNIWGTNSPEWFLADLAAIFAGGKAAGIYPTDTVDQVTFKCIHSGSKVVFVEDNGKVDKFAQMVDNLPQLLTIVVWADTPTMATLNRKTGDSVSVLSWDDFMGKGATVEDSALQARIDAQDPGHCCTLIYTSGTTGNPKAVMISHDNIIFEARCVAAEMPKIAAEPSEERIISYLPLSHVAGMMVDIITPLTSSAFRPGWVSVNFARPYDLKVGSIGDRLKAVKPTLFLGVPRVWEKIAEKMKAIGKSTTGTKLKIAKWAKAKGLEHARASNLAGYSSAYSGDGSFPAGYSLAEKLVLNKVKEALGLDECKFGFTGAAPITVDTLEYFGALGIQINEVYGMSECTGATTWSTDESHVWGSCGYAMAGTEVAIIAVDEGGSGGKRFIPYADDIFAPAESGQGEICYRGRHIMMGYLSNPSLGADHVAEIQAKTAGAIDSEGWLHSGDKGCMSKDGMVRITGRFKELIIGAGGENIAPVPIEDHIKLLCPAISNVMMVGDKRKYNTCLVTLKAEGATGEKPGTDALAGDALTLNASIKTISAAMTDVTVRKHISDAIQATNTNPKVCISNACVIQKFELLPTDFSVEGGELTATLKLKRSVAEAKWTDFIEKMY